MKKYLYPLIVVIAIAIGVGAGNYAYNLETKKYDVSNLAQSQVYLLTKYNTADTIYNFGNQPIGKFKDIYCEVQGLSDSIRTIEIRTLSHISTDTAIGISLIRVDSSATSTTRFTGAQSLNAGQRKTFKIDGNYDNFVIIGEGRYNVKVRFWATGEQ